MHRVLARVLPPPQCPPRAVRAVHGRQLQWQHSCDSGRRHSVLVDTVNARMFALGGSIPPSDSVESTAIDGCGDLGTWETETALPMAVQGHAVVFYNVLEC